MQYGNQLATLLQGLAQTGQTTMSPEEAANARRVSQIMQALQLQPFENIAVTSGGSSGLAPGILSAFGQIGGALAGRNW